MTSYSACGHARTCAAEVVQPSTVADEALVRDPFREHEVDDLWRARFVGTECDAAWPLVFAESVGELEPCHTTPLDVDPTLHPKVVRRLIAKQARAADGVTPLHFCGKLDGEWQDATPACAEYFLHGKPDGHRTRGLTGYHFHP